ncbi:Hypothetical predicted protein [Cloeon dipterum]|uniref:Bee-milk protein n=1 Tax=Cloeon dipterum TaxID=197152 RepID=A0A8S1DTS4_9INSE|nr:Hypothetical predicted protein [Cloeon dipterum]
MSLTTNGLQRKPGKKPFKTETTSLKTFSTSSGKVPWTLAWLPTDGPKKNFPKLNLFPSKKLSEKWECNMIHLIKAMRVDSVGRLWAVDLGSKICPAKLWIFDLKNNDSIVLVYNFPKEILSYVYHQLSLIDVVVDERMTDTFAYISEHYYGTLIVFSLRTRSSRNTNIVMNENFDNIAMSSGIRTKYRYLYFSSRGKSGVYALPVFDLRDGKAESVAPTLVGNKASGSFNIIMDSKDILYFDVLNKTLIRTWNTSLPFNETYYYLEDPDESEPKFCLDHNDHLWLLTRNTVNRRSFRLVRIKVISMNVTVETVTTALVNFTQVYEWDEFDFEWKYFILKRNLRTIAHAPSEIAVFEKRLFACFFSYSHHLIPFTLTWMPTDSALKSPKQYPFPSWKFHVKGNCNAMQRVKSVQVDSAGRLWAFDVANGLCPRKLWIFDLKNDDSLLLVHSFPENTKGRAIVLHIFRNFIQTP